MVTRDTVGLAVAVLGGFLACGLPLWPIPYSDVRIPGNPSAVTWLIFGGLAGLVAGWLLPARKLPPILGVTSGFGMAVMARVAVETAQDPTSHNLWPFEVLYASFFGVVAATLGVLLARLVQRMSRPAE